MGCPEWDPEGVRTHWQPTQTHYVAVPQQPFVPRLRLAQMTSWERPVRGFTCCWPRRAGSGSPFLRGGLLTGFCESRFTTAAGRVTQPAEMPDHPSSDEVSASDEKSMTLMMRHTLHARMGLAVLDGWMVSETVALSSKPA